MVDHTTRVKATFTFDQATIRRLEDAAKRLHRPKSEIVRDAIQEFHSRMDRLSDAERDRLLAAFDKHIPNLPKRSRADIDKEIAEIRRARHQPGGGRRTPVD